MMRRNPAQAIDAVRWSGGCRACTRPFFAASPWACLRLLFYGLLPKLPVRYREGFRARVPLAKAALRLLPFIGLLYLVSFPDRVNIGFAELTMNADIGLSAAA